MRPSIAGLWQLRKSYEYQIGITSLLRYLQLVFLFLALWANTIEIEPVTCDLETRHLRHLLGRLAQGNYFWINDFLALDADQVRVRIWFVPIVTIAIIAKAQFQDFTHLFEQRHCLVDRRQTGRWKIHFHRFVHLIYAGMSRAGRKDSEDSDPLWCEAVSSHF